MVFMWEAPFWSMDAALKFPPASQQTTDRTDPTNRRELVGWWSIEE